MKKTFFMRMMSGFLAVIMVVLLLPAGAFATFAEAENGSSQGSQEPEGEPQQALWEVETYGAGVVVTKYNGTATDVYVPATLTVAGIEKKLSSLATACLRTMTASTALRWRRALPKLEIVSFTMPTRWFVS